MNRACIDKITAFHRESTDKGLNKRNKGLFKIDYSGQVDCEFTWDEVWEQEEIDSYKNETELVRQKWYWEQK